MALNKVEICGVDTSKLPLLKEDEKKELFARIKQGDQEAKEEYINRREMIKWQQKKNILRGI